MRRLKIYRWDKDWETVIADHAGSDFVAIDPGETGAAVVGDSFHRLDSDISQWGDFELTVVEGQYVGVNPSTALRLSFGAGVLCGRLGRDVLIVPPSVWHVVLDAGKGRQQLKAAAAVLAANRSAKLPAWNNALLEGACDAFAISEWWRWARENAAKGEL